MRIVQVMGEIETRKGGVVRAVLDLSQGLASRGHNVTVLTRKNYDAPDEFVTPGEGRASLKELGGEPGTLGTLSKSEARTVRAVLDGADAVHFHAVWHPVYLGIARIARELGIRTVVSTHGMLDDHTMGIKPFKKRLYMAIAGRKLLGAIDVIHCAAQAELDQSKRWFGPPAGRGVVLPLALDVAPYEQPVRPDLAREHFGLGDAPLVVFLGRLHPIKGLDHLVAAMPRVHQTDPSAKLVLAGPHEVPSHVDALRRSAESLGVADRVMLPGSVTGELKVSLLKAASAFVLPSSHENFGLVVPEAMVCDTPAVVTRGVSIWREIEQAGAALAVDQNAAAIGEAVASLIADPTRANEMGKRGADWVRTHLAPDAVLQRYEALYTNPTEPSEPPTH